MILEKYKLLLRFLLLTLCCVVLITITYDKFVSSKVCAEIPGCPSWVETDGKGWFQNETVYVNFGNITDTGIQNQIKRAITTWNTANQSNNSKVKFSYDSPPSITSPILNFQTGPTSGVALASKNPEPATDTVRDATITFNNMLRNGSTRVYQPGAAGYENFFEKVALHEIGHTMGLSHPDPHTDTGQRPKDSVMNLPSGKSNDSGNNMPTTVTDCDQTAVKSQTNLYRPLSTFGGGGGGDGGCPCGNCTSGCNTSRTECRDVYGIRTSRSCVDGEGGGCSYQEEYVIVDRECTTY